MKIIIITLSIIFFSSPAFGEFYTWTDENGVKNFSNTTPPDQLPEGTKVETSIEVKYNAEKDVYYKEQQKKQVRQIEQANQQEENENRQKKLKELKAQREQEKIQGKEATVLAEKQRLEEEDKKRERDAKESSKTARQMYIKKKKLTE